MLREPYGLLSALSLLCSALKDVRFCALSETRNKQLNTAHKKDQHCAGVTRLLRIGLLYAPHSSALLLTLY
jgi:hypothetical protein